MIQKLLPLLKNKYYLSMLLFFIWMLFLDRNDLISQFWHHRQLRQLEKDKLYYQEEILKVRSDMEELNSNRQKLEKFAREKYFMKKDNEDIFLIEEE